MKIDRLVSMVMVLLDKQRISARELGYLECPPARRDSGESRGASLRRRHGVRHLRRNRRPRGPRAPGGRSRSGWPPVRKSSGP